MNYHFVLPLQKMKIDQNVHYTLKSYIEKNRLLLKNVHYNQIKKEDAETIIVSDFSFLQHPT